MRKFYIFVYYLYNFIFSSLEKIFLYNKLDKKNFSKLLSDGFETVKLSNIFDIQPPEKVIRVNPYMTKDILDKNFLNHNLKNFFEINNLKEIISKRTGYNYSIDYIISYTTFKIPKAEKDKEIYANHWHLDKPFSKNTLKIIIPMSYQDYYNGEMKIFNLNQTKKLKKKNINFDNENYIEMRNKESEIFLFFPNLCFHKAGNPISNEGRKQLMMQLNPSKKWCLNENLYEKQFNIEPKFPFFNYINDNKKSL